MIPFESFIKRLALASSPSRHRSSLHAAIIYKGKRIFGIGINQMKTHTRQHRATGGVKPFLHAEIAAIIDAGEVPPRAKMTIVRISEHGKLMNSRPCEYCMAAIEAVGIRSIMYSIDGGFKKETV